MSWLRLQTCLECIPHPCHMYTKCFNTLICCGWAYGSALTLFCLCRSGVDFRKIELCPSPSDVVMSWLRLQTCLKCIPHPSHIYTKCFNTLICHAWANVCILTLLCLWRSGVDFRKIGVLGRSLSDVVMSWLRLQTHMESIVHPFHMYTKCFITLICHGWVYGCALTLLSLCRSGVDFRKIAVGQSLSDVAISWLRLQHAWIASHIHVICIHTQCFGTLICCGWAYGYGSTLTLLCLGRSGVDFRKIELCPSPSDVVMS